MKRRYNFYVALCMLCISFMLAGCHSEEEKPQATPVPTDAVQEVTDIPEGSGDKTADTERDAAGTDGSKTAPEEAGSEKDGSDAALEKDDSEKDGSDAALEKDGSEKDGSGEPASEDRTQPAMDDEALERYAQMSGMSMEQIKAMMNQTASMSDEDMAKMAELYGGNSAEPVILGELALPASSTVLSKELALQALSLCGGHTKAASAKLFTDNGFEIVLQRNFEKAYSDESHTCAYTIAQKTVNYGGKDRPLIAVAIRGTSGAEWYSNFDYSDSRTDDTVYADNFLFAAQSISVDLVSTLIANPDALILVCGHSRGAAAANLLGMLLNESKGKENVFCYTFATPNTYRGAEEKTDCDNIFNYINPGDVVPYLPLAGLGYRRIGTDIMLPGNPEDSERISASMDILCQIAPTISQYYGERHSLVGAGLSDDGMTAYEVMLAFASQLTGMTTAQNNNMTMNDIMAIMQENPGSAESDFVPVFEVLKRISFTDGGDGMTILAQHMPNTYKKLIEIA